MDEARRRKDICSDCLDPVAAGLKAIHSRWRIFYCFATHDKLSHEYHELTQFGQLEDPTAAKHVEELSAKLDTIQHPARTIEIEWLYQHHEIEQAIAFFKLMVSVDFAKDFRRQLYGPLKQIQKVERQARELLDGHPDGDTYWKYPIRRAIAQEECLARLEKAYSDKSQYAHEQWIKHEQNIEELSEGESLFLNRLSATIGYLHQTSAGLRQKFPVGNVPKPAQAIEESISETQSNLLVALLKLHPMRAMQVDLESKADISRKTIGLAMEGLISFGYAARKGLRSGYNLTPKGKAVAEQLPQKNP